MNIKKTFILFLFIFVLLNLSLTFANNNTENRINNYFRIHVVANSDNINDQLLKLHVAKNVEEYISSLTKQITNKDEYINCVSDNIYNILKVAKNTIIKNDMNYNVAAYIGNIKYDQKAKNNIVMEAGIYNSLKIVIGEGNGENWWSLLFPNSTYNVTVNEMISSEEIVFSSGILQFVRNLFNTSTKTN